MARREEKKVVSPWLKKTAIVVASVSLGAVVLPALGIVAVFMALFAPAVVPFILSEGVADAHHAHA